RVAGRAGGARLGTIGFGAWRCCRRRCRRTRSFGPRCYARSRAVKRWRGRRRRTTDAGGATREARRFAGDGRMEIRGHSRPGMFEDPPVIGAEVSMINYGGTRRMVGVVFVHTS